VVNCVVERGVTVVICVVGFDAEKHATFSNFIFDSFFSFPGLR
jgi:hypothetical protein